MKLKAPNNDKGHAVGDNYVMSGDGFDVNHRTWATYLLDSNSIIGHAEIRDARLFAEESATFMGCNFTNCDLSHLQWKQLRMCRIVACLLPGDEAGACCPPTQPHE